MPKTAEHVLASPVQLTIQVAAEPLGPLGYVVIDRTVFGRASGGIRFGPDTSADELTELARTMTDKWAFLRTPMGGAKAGIFATPGKLGCSRAELMHAFGKAIGPLVRANVFLPGLDLGTTLDDLRAVMQGAGRPLTGRQIDGSMSTSLTVFETAKQVLGAHDVPLAGLRVALEGFGKVGGHTARLFAEHGARVVAVSTVVGGIHEPAGLDVFRLLELRAKYGDSCVRYCSARALSAVDELFTLPVDLLIPGARPHVIHTGNAERVQARFVIPISNAPLTHEAEDQLTKRGVVVVPDFVANCGGILASAMMSDGFDFEDVRGVVRTAFASVIQQMLEIANERQWSLADVAREVANRNHVAFEAESGHPRLNRLVELLRRGQLAGLWRRLAWRIHYRWPSLRGPVRRSAVARFSELTFSRTLVGS